ncbi:MAG: FAD:protein FMN transferase [Clostridia bacterium]|jgi:thiamine biosynthesis lipoprotein|nr:FAD:protein FMN transferase [Clostridia bacterium]
MRKISKIIAPLLLVLLVLTGCQAAPKEEAKENFRKDFFEYFDTVTRIIGYADSEEEFNEEFDVIKSEFKRYHELFDIYHTYEGINNIKTINDNAGIEPVEVDQEIIDLLLFSKEWYEKTNGKANIAMGAVLRVWSDYREEGMDFPDDAKLPPMELLEEKNEHTDINKIIIDDEKNTVFLEDPEMSIDVGAVAKGYATERVADHMRERGFTSIIISAGGNVKAMDKPLDGVRERWGIGIQNPDESIFTDMDSLDTVFNTNIAVVTSGDYQRYYYVDGVKYHHLIDAETLMPGTYFKAVTVVMEDSGLADFMSTTLFLSSLEEGKEMLSQIEGAHALWVTHDNEIILTEGFEEMLKSGGASGAD